MKKTFTLVIAVMLLGLTGAFANEIKVAPKVLEAFKKEFALAKDIKWMQGENYYRASFEQDGQNLFAYFSNNGDLNAVARYISSFQLPLNLYSSLKKEFDDYWITDLFEVYKSNETNYYITLENAETIIKQKATNGGKWTETKVSSKQ